MRVRADLEWATRGYQSGDEGEILNLLETEWKPHSVEYWNWLYRENPEGHSIIRVAECEHELVAHAALIPVVMKMGEEFRGYVGLDGVTHPDHRGKGIMKALAKELGAEVAARGLGVGYGTTEVGTMVRIYIALTSGRPGRMKDFLLVLNLRKMLSRRDLGLLPKVGAVVLRTTHEAKILHPPDQVEIEQISEFDESFDELWNAISSSLGNRLVIKKSRAYLSWRYSLHPEYKYLTWVAKENDILLGYVIARHDRTEDSHRGLIADIFGFDDRGDAMKALVSNVVRYFDEQGAELVRCRLSDGHPCARILEDVGFVARPSNYLLSLGVVSPAAGVDQAWLLRKENHMITSGDAHVDTV